MRTFERYKNLYTNFLHVNNDGDFGRSFLEAKIYRVDGGYMIELTDGYDIKTVSFKCSISEAKREALKMIQQQGEK